MRRVENEDHNIEFPSTMFDTSNNKVVLILHPKRVPPSFFLMEIILFTFTSLLDVIDTDASFGGKEIN